MEIKNTSNPDRDKYKYSGHGIGFDSKGEYAHQERGMSRNVITFGADMTNSKHANNRTKNILVLGRDFLQKIDDTTIYAEKMHLPNFTVDNKTFCLSLHYNGDNSYLFVNGKIVIKFKANAQDFKATQQYAMCLGNISSDFNQTDRISTGLSGYVF